jgi:hypothetical protein
MVIAMAVGLVRSGIRNGCHDGIHRPGRQVDVGQRDRKLEKQGEQRHNAPNPHVCPDPAHVAPDAH